MEVSDAELIEKYKLGNEEAFDELLQRYRVSLFNYILRMIKNKTVAEDIFQNVWVKIIKLLPRYKEQNKFSSLLFKIAYSKTIDYLRRSRYDLQSRENLPIPFSNLSIEREIEKKELLSLLNKAVMELPLKQKEIFLLRQHSTLTFKEIAKILSCPLNTVLARMHNAVINLQKALKGL